MRLVHRTAIRHVATIGCSAAIAVGLVSLAQDSAGASGSGVSAAKAAVAKAETRPTSIDETTPISKKIPKGKTVDFLYTSIPQGTRLIPIAQAAGKLLGWNVDPINAGLSPDAVSAAMTQAVQNQPSAVIVGGFAPTYYSQQLSELASDHIPVVLFSVTIPQTAGVSAVFNNGKTSTAGGKLQAEYDIVTNGTKANTLIVGAPAYAGITAYVNGFKSEYQQLCPSCTIAQVTLAATTLGTANQNVPITTYLQSHPDVNVVDIALSTVAQTIPAALTTGTKPQIYTVGVTEAGVALIKNGTLTMSMQWDTELWIYRSFDYLARHFAGVSTAPAVNAADPFWLLTGKNASQVKATTALDATTDFPAKFKALWHAK